MSYFTRTRWHNERGQQPRPQTPCAGKVQPNTAITNAIVEDKAAIES